jgi:hypothetical protein
LLFPARKSAPRAYDGVYFIVGETAFAQGFDAVRLQPKFARAYFRASELIAMSSNVDINAVAWHFFIDDLVQSGSSHCRLQAICALE